MMTEPGVEEVQITPYNDPSEASIASQATPGMPSFAQAAPEAASKMRKLDKQEAGELDKLKGLDASDLQLSKDREKGVAGPRQAFEDSIKAALPDELKLNDPPQAPDSPVIDKEQFQKFGAFAFPFVLLLGAAMRADGVQALNALSSSVQGFMQGSTEKSKREFETFKAKFDQVIAQNQKKLDEYKSIMARKDLDMQRKQMLYQVAAMKYDDAAAYNSAQRHSVQDQLKFIEKERENQLKLAQKYMDISKNYEKNMREKEKNANIKAISENKFKYHQAASHDAQHQKLYQGLVKQQQEALNEYVKKMSTLASLTMDEGRRQMAERELRLGFVFKIKTINSVLRANGMILTDDMDAAEHIENDPLAPTSSPDSAQKQDGWLKQFGSYVQSLLPGAQPAQGNPAAPMAPKSPAPGGGVVDFNKLPP